MDILSVAEKITRQRRNSQVSQDGDALKRLAKSVTETFVRRTSSGTSDAARPEDRGSHAWATVEQIKYLKGYRVKGLMMDAAAAKDANQRFLVKAQRFAFYRGAMRYIAHWKGLIQRHKSKQAAAHMFAKGTLSKPFIEFQARIRKQQLLRAIYKEVANTGLTDLENSVSVAAKHALSLCRAASACSSIDERQSSDATQEPASGTDAKGAGGFARTESSGVAFGRTSSVSHVDEETVLRRLDEEEEVLLPPEATS